MYAVITIVVILLSSVCQVSAQGCAKTCPPINFGKPVPSLCEGDLIESRANINRDYSVCHPTNIPSNPSSFALEDFRGSGKITVIANYYSGCNAGRRESGVFAHVAQRFHNLYGSQRVTFIQSLKGGGTCQQWADLYQRDAQDLYPDSEVVPNEVPLSINDDESVMRDDLFTAPFGHPSYVILDGDLKIRHKFIGPCCGYEDYFACTADIAKTLDNELTSYIFEMLQESFEEPTASPVVRITPAPTISASPTLQECQIDDYSDWSECSIRCIGGGEDTDTNTISTNGIQFRWRVSGTKCNKPVERRPCTPIEGTCTDEESSCIAEFGNASSYTIETVASGFASPRDVDFHPTPGLHLKNFAEGRTFHPDEGEEAWVANGANHSVSIVASLGTEFQTTISRRDRGYYHYMVNATALAFNKVADSGRSPDRDAFNYWAICNDNTNTYIGTKEPNFFMGPTLYNSDPNNGNTVSRLGSKCREEEGCYFLHSDMLHESPACIGIAHDTENTTTYGNVYWAFDATGNRQNGQLVRFDFQQPHGPGSMDHSVAAVRRYVEVDLERGPPGVHAGMEVHPSRREVYIAVPGGNKIVVVDADSGSFARTAREEFPIYSNRLPSFEYSIYECSTQRVFAEGIQTPTGIALSIDGERLFVGERGTGKIIVFEVASGAVLYTINTGFKTIGGMAISPVSNMLFFVDDETNTLNKVHRSSPCSNPIPSRINYNFEASVAEAAKIFGDKFIFKDYNCEVNPMIPDASFFDQVHSDSGYADENEDVQSVMAGMDASAALLANRTDCGYKSDLNFDALLLGGYYCHMCLPEQEGACDPGGRCTNTQWLGLVCDNEYRVHIDLSMARDRVFELSRTDGVAVEPQYLSLKRNVTYRFTVLENESDLGLCIYLPEQASIKSRRLYGLGSKSNKATEYTCATKGPLLISVADNFPSTLIFFVEGNKETFFAISVQTEEHKKKKSYGAIAAIVVVTIGVILIISALIWKKKCIRK